MGLPLLGVMVGMYPPAALRPLLLSVSDRCYPLACTAVEPLPEPAPRVFLWAGGSARPPRDAVWAAWLGRGDDLGEPVVRDARLLLCDAPATADRAGDRALLVPPAAAPSDARPLPPFVRRRLRRARGLSSAAVVRGDGSSWYWNVGYADRGADPLPADLVGTALGAAAAVVAIGAGLVTALAWAAPTVTDPASAAALGARDGVQVLVDPDPAARLRLAAGLAGDDARAARLGRRGWLLARDRTDLGHCGWTMLRRLGLPTHPVAGRTGILEDQMDALGTPPSSSTRTRIRGLVGPLPALAAAGEARS